MATFGAAAYSGRIRRALLFKEHSVLWCGLGRTSEWVDEQYPPEPVLSRTTIEEPFLYYKADFITLCVWSDVESDVVVAGNNYTYVLDEDAPELYARYLYAQFTFDGTIGGMPEGTFRQTGIFSNLVPASRHENDTWLVPADVSSVGTLEYISNRRPVTFSNGEIRMERAVLEFK